MTVTFRPAQRVGIWTLLGFAGGTGSGKTYSAMRVAKGLSGGERFAVIDTEAGRALHYADDFDFDHALLEPPFRPDAYGAAIDAAAGAGYKVIVVDSFSHEHAGDGGLLDWHEEELQRLAGDDWKKREAMKMSAWIRPKTEHKKLVSRLLQVKAHLIICLRAEEKVEIVKDDKGKTVVRPKQSLVGADGWVPIAERNLPFELTVSFLLTAAQPGVPKPIKLPERCKSFFPLDRPVSEDSGSQLRAWAAGSSGTAASGDSGVGQAVDVAAPRTADAEPDEIPSPRTQLLALYPPGPERDAVADYIDGHARTYPDTHDGWLSDQLEKKRAEGQQERFPIPEAARS